MQDSLREFASAMCRGYSSVILGRAYWLTRSRDARSFASCRYGLCFVIRYHALIALSKAEIPAESPSSFMGLSHTRLASGHGPNSLCTQHSRRLCWTIGTSVPHNSTSSADPYLSSNGSHACSSCFKRAPSLVRLAFPRTTGAG